MDSDYTTVRKNIVSGSRIGMCILAKGQRTRLENNVLVANVGARYVMGFHQLNSKITAHLSYLDVPEEFIVQHNVMVVPRENSDFLAVFCHINWNEHRFAAFDENLYWFPGRDPITIPWTELRWGEGQKPRRPTNQELAHVEHLWEPAGGRFDRHSLFADPLFVDPKRHDFRLQPQSPALGLGFEPIDVDSIGLKADFPPRLRQQAAEQSAAAGSGSQNSSQ